MDNKLTVRVIGVKEFSRAIERNPRKVKDELAKFFIRAKSEYNQTMMRNPWQVGGSGGGAPVDTGALRDSHQSGTKIRPFKMTFGPDERIASYAGYVHEGTNRMKARPWLNYTFDKKERKVRDLADDMLQTIVKDLSR